MAGSASSFPSVPSRAEEPSIWLWAAVLASLVALAGSLYLSIGMGLRACPLCYYQRTFVMGVTAILVVGMFAKDLRPGVLSLLALPLAVAGLGVAGYHEFLVQSGALECPHGVMEFGSAPQQSLAILAVLTVLLTVDQMRQQALPAIAGAMVLGALLAFGGIMSSASACPNYEKLLNEDMCRPIRKA